MSTRDLAIALGYAPGHDLAPHVLASGDGITAARIREIAERRGIPIHEDAELTALLRHVPLEHEIPRELYPAVAEIFAFIWSLADAGRDRLAGEGVDDDEDHARARARDLFRRP